MTLAEFLLARIDREERAALALCPGRSADNGHWRENSWSLSQLDDAKMARHVARWDPARVLRECEAKRRIVERWEYRWREAEEASDASLNRMFASQATGLHNAIQLLAEIYADHPDYQDEWRP